MLKNVLKISATSVLAVALGWVGFIHQPEKPAATANQVEPASQVAVKEHRQQAFTSRSGPRQELVSVPASAEPEFMRLTEMETEKLPFEKETVEDAAVLQGETKVKQKGKKGEKRHVFAVSLDGEERTLLYTIDVKDPVTEVVVKGTKKPELKPQPTPKSSTPSSAVPNVSDNPSGNRAIGKEMVLAKGWGADQYKCLDALWTRESNWRTTAKNPSSGAYGIPQAYPGGKLASAGSDWQTNPRTQIKWGLGYIQNRYGTPCSAWGHSQQKGWY